MIIVTLKMTCYDVKMYFKNLKKHFFLTYRLSVHVQKEGGRFVAVKEELERLAQKYPEFTDMLKGGVIPGEVIDAELAEFKKMNLEDLRDEI